MISLGTPRSAGENFRSTWEHLGVPATSLDASSLGAPTTSLRAPVQSLGEPRITVEQSGKIDIVFANAACTSGNHCNYLSFNDFKTHVFRLYSQV